MLCLYLVDVLKVEFILLLPQNRVYNKLREITAFLGRIDVGEFFGPSLSKVIV